VPANLTATAPAQLGETIVALRPAAGLTQAALADKLKTTRGNVSRLEKGHSMPSTTTLQKIGGGDGEPACNQLSEEGWNSTTAKH